MTDVAPFKGLEPLSEHSTRRQKLLTLFGLGYVVLTIGCSWWFCLLLAQSTSNDAFWFGFNDTVQAWLMEAFNQLDHDYPLDLSSLMYAQPQIDFSGVITLHQTQSRLLFYNQVPISPAVAILKYRKANPSTVLAMSSYCWVDFNQTWELAHTSTRQKRCYDCYRNNGAVYLEALLRNTNMTMFESSFGGSGGLFTISIAQTLRQTDRGRFFLHDLRTMVPLNIEDEVQYWNA
ncbi:hypothetical protein LEN26_010625 [Aphanomyces euteiches]|nr:hypothetical protein LEN26_010625 [Aphanomyces euteiches]KAH9193746.1 hypothetical protein AeNC1_004277 [Aphanomyces euteiches]